MIADDVINCPLLHKLFFTFKQGDDGEPGLPGDAGAQGAQVRSCAVHASLSKKM